ncbi:DMT family transporter [Halovulum dunhuangense]|uniref:DMT family transporter n=1 Tax=Halovulum dunhuangense TaxID=1505036 RepID=A0A849L4Q1_9RHOB|nr:DMT family transporter [Halovulum dunhuangense]NNU81335.1 DMT family transporter [Halovulum dunhuangense]
MPALYGALLVLGLFWGVGIPLTKIAVGAGYAPLGLIAWQTIYMTLFLSIVLLVRGGGFRLGRRHWRLYAVIALSGTLIPNSFGYRAAAELPAGVMSIIIALVPMFALPVALALGLERWRWARLGGVALGGVAVALIAGPETSLPAGTEVAFVALALVAPLSYAIEGNYLALKGTGGLGPFEVLWGASLLGALVAVPAALASGDWIDPRRAWGVAEWAILGNAVSHGIAYAGYVWLVGRAGAVFAAQVAYLVTGAGVLWSMALLGERYSGWVWLALVLMLAGVSLVQPRAGAARRAGA